MSDFSLSTSQIRRALATDMVIITKIIESIIRAISALMM